MSEKHSISHRALDDLVKFKTAIITDVGQFKVDILKSVQEIVKAVGEVQTKHNDLAAHITAVEGVAKNTAAFAASEMGKMGGTVQRHLNDLGRTTSAIDINVLALAELGKELVGQITQIDALISKLHAAIDTTLSDTSVSYRCDGGPPSKKTYGDIRRDFKKALELTAEDVQEIKTNAEKWYGDLVASAFKTVRTRIEADETAYRAKQAEEARLAKEAADKVAAESAESKTVENAIMEANASDLSVAGATSGGQGATFPDGAEIFGG